MSHGLSKEFTIEEYNTLEVGERAGNTHKFSLITRSSDIDVQFAFQWNDKHGFYVCDIITPDDFRQRVHPRPSEDHMLRNISLNDSLAPDLFILFDIESETITPDNIHDLTIHLMHGRIT